MSEDKFEICARAVALHESKILVCKNKEKGYCFFPGGHIEFGENAKSALVREIKEELNMSIKNLSFIGTVENIYTEDNQKHHEINLVFSVALGKINDKSQESHIEFILFDKDKFLREKVLPIALRKAVSKWLKNKKIFWASQKTE